MVDDGPGAGAPLLLPTGDLIGVLVQNVPDVQGVGHGLDLGVDDLGAVRRMARARAMFSPMVRVSRRLKSWKMKPRFSRRNLASSLGRSRVMSCPSRRMAPATHRVDGGDAVEQGGLAGAGGPMIPKNSPFSTEKLMSSMARVTPPPLP